MNKIKAYIDEVVKEMKKVNWPSQKEVVSNTGITILATVIIAAFVYGADQVISTVLQFVYSAAG
jgi:preprotein translocase subunit SecE